MVHDLGRDCRRDVYIKPTDSHRFLHHASCHPNSPCKGILYAESLRLRRICLKEIFFERTVQYLCSFLVERVWHGKNFVQQQVHRARKENSRIPFTMTFHPGLPNIRDLLRELHAVLHSSNGCLDAIKEVPMVAFRKRKCLSVEVTGTSKCNSNAD